MASSGSETSSRSRDENLRVFCKQMLKSRVFKGFYQERRLVANVNNYRDIVVVNRSEKELKTILESIILQANVIYGQNSNDWVGISTESPNEDVSIWTELDELAFGHYWFMVKSVRFRENELLVKLQPISEIRDSEEIAPATQIIQRVHEISDQSITLDDFYQLFQQWGVSIKQSVYSFLANDINKANIKEALSFISLLLISLLTAIFHGIKLLGVFSLRFLAEARQLLYVSTPIIMRVLDLLGKIVGAFYILLAMIWKDFIYLLFKGRASPNVPRAIDFNRPQNYKYQNIKYGRR